MNIDILNIEAEKTNRTFTFDSDLANFVPNDHSIYLAVKQFLAAQRSGTHKVKTRAEVKGASRKLHKQKGTGGSRKGNIRNPLYKGGGTVFGPKPHKYHLKVNKKEKDLARLSALSYKFKENKVIVLENLNFESPKTKIFTNFLNKTEIQNQIAILILDDFNDNVFLSSRNIPNLKTMHLADLNTYEITKASYVIFTEESAKIINGSDNLIHENHKLNI